MGERRGKLTSRGHQGTFWGDKSVLNHNCGHSHPAACSVKAHHMAHLKWVQFIVSKLYLNKTDTKKYTHYI